jgi:hypothetical protein
MKFNLVLVASILFMLAKHVSSVGVNSVCNVNSGIGELKNFRVKYETIYVERADLTATKSGKK